MLETKICIRCNISKPITSFLLRKDSGKRRNDCYSCHSKQYKPSADAKIRHNASQRQRYADNRNSHIDRSTKYRNKAKYGLTPAQFDKMMSDQGGLCAICGKSEWRKVVRTNRKRLLGVDHDHKTMKIRELLCADCNSALGFVHDDISILQKMISYLEKHR